MTENMNSKKSVLDHIMLILLVVGGLNWGLVGLFNFDLVQFVLGSMPMIAKLVYILVGVSAIYAIYFLSKK